MQRLGEMRLVIECAVRVVILVVPHGVGGLMEQPRY